MSTPLLELLARTHNAGGPLRFARDTDQVLHLTWDDPRNHVAPINSVHADWLSEPDRATYEALAGVLRDDLQQRGLRVMTEYPAHHHGNIRVLAYKPTRDLPFVRGEGTDTLTAHANAWLAANHKIHFRGGIPA